MVLNTRHSSLIIPIPIPIPIQIPIQIQICDGHTRFRKFPAYSQIILSHLTAKNDTQVSTSSPTANM